MSTDGLIDWDKIIELVNETNVNTKCSFLRIWRGGDIDCPEVVPMYPLRVAIFRYMDYRSDDDWLPVIHCMNLGAYIESGGRALADLIVNSSRWEELLTSSMKHKQRFSKSRKGGILFKMRSRINFMDEKSHVPRCLISCGKLLSAGKQLIRCGARIYIEWLTRPHFAKWKLLLVTAEKARSIATTFIWMYKRSKWAIPKDILIMIAKMIYERRFDEVE